MRSSVVTTNRDLLLKIPTPQRTNTYTPITCSLIFNTLDDIVKEQNLEISSQRFVLTQNGNKQKLHFFFNNPNSEFVRELILLNSYNKSLSLRGASGVSVFVCENGVIIGDIKILKRHVGSIDEHLQVFLKMCLDDTSTILSEINKIKENYSKFICQDWEIGEILGRLFYEKNCIGSKQLNIIKEEFKNPSFEYGTDPKSLWTVYQHITYSFKDTAPNEYLTKRKTVQDFISEFYSSAQEIEYSLI